MTHKVEVTCEWDLGCGYTSVWDDKECAESYFKEAFDESQDKTEKISYDDAIRDGLLEFKDVE